MITVRNQQFHFTNSGHLWLLGTSDDVLPCGLCVALIYGKFYVNEHVALEKNKEGAVCYDWQMSSENHEGIFCKQKQGLGEDFPDDVTATLSQFLSFLVRHNGAQ